MTFVTRRTVLAGVVGTGVMGAVAGTTLATLPTVVPADLPTLRVFDPRAAAILAAVASTLCPGGDGLPDASAVDVTGKVDRLLASMHPAVVDELSVLLRLLDSALFGLLLDGRARPFTACDVAARAAGLERWRTSRIPQRRTGYRALHGLIAAAYWSDPRTYSTTGYPGSPFAQGGQP